MRTSLKAVRVFMGAISSQRWPAHASARIWAMSSVLFVRRREADDKGGE
jgi:hypothetical protein